MPGSSRVLARTHSGGVDADRPIIALGQVGPDPRLIQDLAPGSAR
jgi:hypothetical protein